MYQIDNMSLDDTKEKLEWRKCGLESELENTYDTENKNGMTIIRDNEVNNIAEFNLLHDIINPTK